MTQDVPGKVRDPLVDFACFTLVLAGHISVFEFRAEDAHVVIHQGFKLQGVLDVVQLVHGLLAPRVEVIAARAEEILQNVAFRECVVDRVVVALLDFSIQIFYLINILRSDLHERASRIIDRLEKVWIRDANGRWPEANDVAIFFVQPLLCLDVRLAVVVVEAPEVGELGQERAWDLLEWRSQVCQNVLPDNGNGRNDDGLDE